MNIEEKIEQLRQVQKVDAPPFLLTRIRAKIQASALESVPRVWVWGGILTYSCLLILAIWLPLTAQSAADVSPQDSYWSFPNAQLYVD